MASRLMHYIIAEEILKTRDYDRPKFILGNLAPDAHDGTLLGPNGNAHTHFRYIINGEYDKLPNIEYLRFNIKYKSYFNDDFVLGYYCHLISDHVWTKSDFLENLSKMDNTDPSFLDKRKILHNDFYALNGILPRILKIKFDGSLSVNIYEDFVIDEFVKENLYPILEATRNDFQSKEGNLRMITVENALDYLERAGAMCLENIESKRD